MKIALYLQRSPKTGVYSFRHVVPICLRQAVGRREIKRSLKTKNEREAVAKASVIYEQTAKLFAALRERSGEAQSPRVTYEAAVSWADALGFNPFEKPDPYRDEDDYLARDNLADPLKEKAEAGNATALDLMKLSGILGTLKVPEPTVSEAVSLYLSERNRPQDRSDPDRLAFEQMVRRYESYLLRSLRTDKQVKQVNRADARAFRDWLANDRPDGKALKPGSINKALRIVRAMFTHAIREWELDIANPFAGLRVEEREAAKDLRRPFTDEELTNYLKAAELMNDQARHCTILMAYTGARTREITGLECGDISVNQQIPHIHIRPNLTRPKLKTPVSKRVIPLVGNAVKAAMDALSSLGSERDPKAPVFPRYAKGRGADALSALQNKQIRERLGVNDPKLVAYSTRHTLKDYLRNALLQPDLQDAILAHNRGQVSDGYGSGYWLPRLREALTQAYASTPLEK